MNWGVLERADVSYTTLGRKDTVYIGMFNGKRNYKRKHYFLKASLFTKSINANLKQSYLLPNAHDLVEMVAFNLTSKDCMVGDCTQCSKPGLSLLEVKEKCAMITFSQS